jgi:ABC-2 type transport system ATP-binding protein
MIETSGLNRYYGKIHALKDFSLRAEKGEVVGLVGPNGSGKSTAMKIIATLMRPSSGKASICGRDVVREPLEAKRNLGYVPEKAAVWEDLNAPENLFYWGRMQGMAGPALKGRIEPLLKELGLEGERKLAATFSKGMKQRLAIGMALLHSPQVVILDEPTTGLDPDGRLMLRNLILALANEGRTVLVSTHELLEAAKVCNRVVFMKLGAARGTGDPVKEDLEARYKELTG